LWLVAQNSFPACLLLNTSYTLTDQARVTVFIAVDQPAVDFIGAFLSCTQITFVPCFVHAMFTLAMFADYHSTFCDGIFRFDKLK
jgi:hypothetical protein